MIKIFISGLFVLFLFVQNGYSQVPSQYERIDQEVEREEELRERIKEEAEEPEVEKKEEEEKVKEEKAIKVFIKEIRVTGVTIFSEEEIRKITAPYENRELSLKEIHKIADLITDLYRRNEYITSRAYIPAQNLSGEILEISVLEGKMGKLKIEGNRHFKSKVFTRKMRLEEGDNFDYGLLRKSLVKINEHQDRAAKAVLLPGEEPGQTDVVLKVQDRQPFHVGFEYDNYASRYLEEKRYAVKLINNNLTGNDDLLTLKFLKYHSADLYMESLRYILPFYQTWELGLYAMHNETKLAEELEDLDVEGKSTLFSLFLNKYLMDNENFDLRLTLGFDYKNTRNYQLGAESSRDDMRIAKAGIDIDESDKHGRTIAVTEFSYGMGGFWDGLDDVDSRASRSGSGGKFTKFNVWLLRLQRLPFHSSVLLKNQIQVSPYILTSSEQFQSGGITNNRGYPPAEKVGDEGVSSVVEFSTPLYIVPKHFLIPFSTESVYEALTMVAFYDFARTKLKRPQSGEENTDTLKSVGCGLRLNIPNRDFSARLEFGWPLGNETPSDGDHLHTWVEISKSF